MILSDEVEGAFAFSFVKAPATRSNFVYMSEEKKTLALSADEKHIVTGLALAPGQRIYRNEFAGYTDVDLIFSEETILKASQKFLQNYHQKEVTREHDAFVNEVTLSETWIKTDAEKDKSVALGIEAPVGSWFISYKVNNVELWESIKKGEVLGFSIEGFFEPSPVSLTINKKDEIMPKNGKDQVENQEVVTPEVVVEASTEDVAPSFRSQFLAMFGITQEAEVVEAEEEVEAEEPTYVSVEAFNVLVARIDALETVEAEVEEVEATEETEVVEVVEATEETQEEVEMVSLSDGKEKRTPKVKYDAKDTVKERIIKNLAQ